MGDELCSRPRCARCAAGATDVLSRRLAAAIARGASFLEASRGEDGLWRDFKTLAGPSSEWVSAFVACALTQAAPGFSLSSILLRLAERQRANGGWGYNRSVPTDCVSTAWAVLAWAVLAWAVLAWAVLAWAVLARSSGPEPYSAVTDRGVEYICAHQTTGRGFSA
jgi:hypothetical protein